MLATILILAVIGVLFVFAVRYTVRNGTCGGCPVAKQARAHGASACSGHCASCSGCAHAGTKPFVTHS